MNKKLPATGFHTNPERINRKGRPKGISITAMVKEALEEVEPKTKQQWKHLIVKKILVKAVADGDTQLIKAIWSYIDGLPVQRLGGEEPGEGVIIRVHDYGSGNRSLSTTKTTGSV